MRRPLVAIAGSLVGLVAVTTAAIAVVDHDQRDGGTGYGIHQMNGPAGRADHDRLRDPGHWMDGAADTSECGYLAEMVAHHEEAVAAATELQRSDRPELRDFGASIVASQTAQIEQMQAWLAEWYPGRSADVDYQPMMRDLTGLSGDQLDRVFLEDMIAHHMIAVMMSQQLLVRQVADHDEANALASAIRDEQHAEIFWMRHKLAEWFDAGPRHGMGAGMGHTCGGNPG